MTNRKAIRLLSNIIFIDGQPDVKIHTWYNGIDLDYEEALQMAVEALKKELPYNESEN